MHMYSMIAKRSRSLKMVSYDTWEQGHEDISDSHALWRMTADI